MGLWHCSHYTKAGQITPTFTILKMPQSINSALFSVSVLHYRIHSALLYGTFPNQLNSIPLFYCYFALRQIKTKPAHRYTNTPPMDRKDDKRD